MNQIIHLQPPCILILWRFFSRIPPRLPIPHVVNLRISRTATQMHRIDPLHGTNIMEHLPFDGPSCRRGGK